MPDPTDIPQAAPTDPRDYSVQAAVDAGVDPALILAQHHQESGFNVNAVSSAGAIGIAQVMPKTFADVASRRFPGQNLDINNPRDNALVGATYMREQLDHYNGDTEKALAAYNAGPGHIDRLVSSLGDDWKAGLPKETADYIPAITKWLPGGQAQPATVQPTEAPSPQGQQQAMVDDQTGNVYGIGPDQAAQAQFQGLRPISDTEAQTRLAQQEYGGGVQRALAGAESILSGLSGGGSDLVEKALGVNPRDILGRRLAYSDQGQILGGLGLGLPLGEVGALTKGAGLAAKVGAQALAFGLSGAAHEASDELLNDQQLSGEAITEAGGLNVLVGAGSELGLWGLGKAINTLPIRGTLGALQAAAREGYISGAELLGTPREETQYYLDNAQEALKAGGWQPLEQKIFVDSSHRATELANATIDKGGDIAKDARSVLQDHIDTQLGSLQSEMIPGGKSGLLDADGNALPPVMPQTSSPVKREALEFLHNARVRLGEHVANSVSTGTLSGEDWAAVQTSYEANQAGLRAAGLQELPPLRPDRGVNALSNSTAQALDILEDRLERSKTQAGDWNAMNGFRDDMQKLVKYDALAAGSVEPGAYESQALARDFAHGASDFTKDPNLFPSIGPAFRDFQAAESRRLGSVSDFMRLGGSIEGGGQQVVGKQRIAGILKKAFADPQGYESKAFTELMDAHQGAADAADKITQGSGAKGMGATLSDLTDASSKAMRALGMSEKAARVGGGASAMGASVGGIGLQAYLARKILDIPYAAAALPLAGYKLLSQPAAVALTKARLTTLLGKLGGRINTGAVKSVATLLAGAAGAAAKGETAEAAREYIKRDLLTGRDYESFEDGVLAHRNTVVAPPDFTNTLQRSTGRLGTEHQTGVALNVAQKINRMAAIAPLSNSIGTADEIPPSRQDMLRYAERAWAIEHPVDALNAQGLHPDPDILADIQATSPNIMARWMQSFDNELHKQWPKDETVPVSVHKAIAQMHGQDLGPPGLFGAHMQAAYALASTPPPDNGQQSGAAPRKPRKGDFKWGESVTLPSHSSMI